MKKYLVTGAAGFIGSNFVKYLLEKWGDDVQVMILDALTYAGNLLTIAEELKRENVEFVRGDIGDRELVSGLMERFDPDYVVNFAAESHVDRSISDPRPFVTTNIVGTQNLLECCRQHWGKQPGSEHHYLQISTDEVYGALPVYADNGSKAIEIEENSVLRARKEAPRQYGEGFFTEDTPLSPRSPYSASKTSADLLAMAYFHTYGFPVSITRCSNNYGPYHFPEKLIPLIINNILKGKMLPVYGKGLNVRDWLYVKDHCRAIDLVVRQGRVGEVYNIGGYNEKRNIDIVLLIIETMRRLLPMKPEWLKQLQIPLEKVTGENLITYVADRPGHDMRYAISPSKISAELGWLPETPFEEGIDKTVRWYLDNPEWVASVTSGDYQSYYEKMYGHRGSAK